MQRLSDMPINRKLTLVILLTCISVLLLAAAAMIATEFLTTRRAMVQETTVLADLLGRNSTAPLALGRNEDVEEVNRMLSTLAADPHIVLAGLYDEKQNLFGSYLRDGADAAVPSRPPADESGFIDGHLEVTRPVEMEGQRIGTIYLRADLQRIYSQLTLYAVIVGLILIAIIVTTFAISPRLRKPIAGPILALAEVARRVASQRDYSARATKRSEDEVGLLTDAFNQMLSEIETTQSSLQRANQSMQSEISERKAVEERLRKTLDELAVAKDAAEAASRAKDQFLAVLSHELRTPLTPVLLTVSLLENRDHLPEEVQEDIQTIRRHVELEARLIDDLLDLTRIARGKLQLTLETADAHLLLKDAVQED